MTNEIITCYYCGSIITNEEETHTIHNGETICEECREEHYVMCEHCEELYELDDTHYINDTIVCDSCRDRHYVSCDCCGEAVLRRDSYTTERGTNICEYCRDHHYYECYECGELVNEDDVFEHNGEYYCQECYNALEDNIAIHDYYYKPDPVFYGTDSSLYMGVELEIDGAGEYNENAERLLCVGEGYIYCKHDGSLEEGFEIVSHPATLEHHENCIRWADIMETALEMGYTSHNAGTCGLHIHVSKKALGYTFGEQDEVIGRILYLFEKHFDKMLKFSRRTEGQLNQWANRYGLLENETPADMIDKAKSSYARYRMINLQPSHTIEFRLFRGTLKYNTFVATLQFVTLICDICINSSDKTIEELSWDEIIGLIPCDYTELLTYLDERHLLKGDN